MIVAEGFIPIFEGALDLYFVEQRGHTWKDVSAA